MMRAKGLAGLVALGVLAAGAASADAVVDWNEITVASVTVGRPGPVGVLDVALVQIAVHDAVQAIEKRYEPYHVEIKGAKGLRSAAVAAAAHDMLVGLYPAQAANLDATYFNYLAEKGLNDNAGLLAGQKAAAGILPLHRPAPNPLPPPFVGGTGPGVWRPTPSFLGTPPAPPPFSPMAMPWLASVDPYTLTNANRFRAEPPPALSSERYTRDYNEVKAVGSLTSSTRTPEQTDVAFFHTDNFVAQWNRALRALAATHVHRIGDSARLFALANVATADSLITCWDTKKFYVFWRPITAINEGESDGNPMTAGDPSWQPLVNNPNYPDYSSGANSFGGAMTQTLTRFFGTDRMTFEVTSNAPLAVQKTRTYHRFSQFAQEVVDARVYLGIHFRFADTTARAQSRRVADWVFDHFLVPTRDDHHGREGYDNLIAQN